MSRALTLNDISDLRAYAREREEFRERIIALKKRRRVHIGPYITLLFENRDTIRFQIQEMARVEKLSTDEAIENELRAYNPLIPEPSQLSATLFIELTSEELLREWLPKLVGIEQSVVFEVAGQEVRCEVDPVHLSQLTREDITASVHYIHWTFTTEQVDAIAKGDIRLKVDHPAYLYVAELTPENIAEFLDDVRG